MANNLDSQPPTPEPSGIAPEIPAAWKFSAIQQAAILFTVVAMNDRTRIYAMLIALAVYWAGAGFIVFLRRSKPILLDLLFLRWSYPLIWLAVLVILTRMTKPAA